MIDWVWVGLFLLTLALRVVIEAGVVSSLMPRDRDRRLRRRVASLAVLITHPFAFGVFFVGISRNNEYILAASLAVDLASVLVKALFLARATPDRDLLRTLFTVCFASAASFVGAFVGTWIAAVYIL